MKNNEMLDWQQFSYLKETSQINIKIKNQNEYLSEDNIKKLCLYNQTCNEESCERVHLRILEGVCIGFLQNFCFDNKQCGLNHFPLDDLCEKLEKTPINGYYQFNICPTKCNRNQCMYGHPQWLQQLCVECINGKACSKANQSLWHQRWNNLRQEIYKQYDRNGLNPELFCANYDACKCPASLQNFDIHCIRYFKGVCPYIKCIKRHVRWENSRELIQQNQEIVQSCIEYNKNQKIFQPRKQVKQKSKIYFEQNFILSLQKQLEIRPQIDLLFILDCTSSMGKWLQSIKENINGIIYQFKKKISVESSVRTAIVCYKDFDDKDHIVYHNFTDHPQEIVDFLEKLEASGGDDIPEDLIGALQLANTLNFSKDPLSILQMLIITDAPCHGRKYHNLNLDSKPDEEGLEGVLSQFQTKKTRFLLSFIQLSPDTLKMEECIKRTIINFQIAQLEPNELTKYMLFTLKSSVTRASTIQEDRENMEIISAEFAKINELPPLFDKRCNQSYLEFIDNFIENYPRYKNEKTQLIFEKQELQVAQKGVESYVYKGFDQKNNQNIILKIPKFYLDLNVKGKVTEEKIKKAEKLAKIRFRDQIIAQSLAQQFNKQCFEKQLDFVPLYFPSPIIYRPITPFKQLSFIYGEIFIENCYEWKKYSNNLDHSDSTDDLTAFSHFTFDASNNQIIVNDLQGCNNILTDPSIQTVGENLIDISQTNHQKKGIESFFQQQHKQCSQICEQLGFSMQNKEQKIFGEKLKNKNLRFICQNCNQIQTCQKEKLNILCSQCQVLVGKSTEAECKCCLTKYLQKQQFDQLRCSLIEMCEQCLISKCSSFQQEVCHYCNQKLCNQKKKYIKQFDDQVSICLEAFDYLRQQKCLKCFTLYKFDKILNREDYSIGKYQCC